MGLAVLLLAAVIGWLVADWLRDRRRHRLQAEGLRLTGRVTRVRVLYAVSYRRRAVRLTNADAEHPWLVNYRYVYRGHRYTGWEILPPRHVPPVAGQDIVVWVDPKHPRRSVAAL